MNTYLFVELDEDWLKKLLIVFAPVVNVLGVTETLVKLGLVGHEVLVDWSWKRKLRNGNILGVSNRFEFNMRHFLVTDVRWVMSGNVAGEFGEVGSHSG